MSLGAFGGSLLMFANLTLVCAILFGEFEVRPFQIMSVNGVSLFDPNHSSHVYIHVFVVDTRLCIKPK